MPKLNLTLRTLAATAGAGAILLAAGPALAASSSPAPSITGPEVISGSVHGKAALANAPIIPLKLTGVVAATSKVNLGGNGAPKKGDTKDLITTAGKLTVEITAKPQNTQSINPKTCAASFAQYLQVAIVGGKSTGSFAGASGPGSVQLSFSAILPRYTKGPHKGQCNPNGEPAPKGAVASFLVGAVMTTK
jgi:hypothetical protein